MLDVPVAVAVGLAAPALNDLFDIECGTCCCPACCAPCASLKWIHEHVRIEFDAVVEPYVAGLPAGTFVWWVDGHVDWDAVRARWHDPCPVPW